MNATEANRRSNSRREYVLWERIDPRIRKAIDKTVAEEMTLVAIHVRTPSEQPMLSGIIDDMSQEDVRKNIALLQQLNYTVVDYRSQRDASTIEMFDISW